MWVLLVGFGGTWMCMCVAPYHRGKRFFKINAPTLHTNTHVPGFLKLALQYGCDVVPYFAFGEVRETEPYII